MEQLLISKAEAVNEIRKSLGGFFSITFIKVNGDERKMTCRLGVKSHRKNNPGIPSTTAHLPKYITVWDAHKKGYRNINVTTFKGLRIKGHDYLVA